MTTIGNYTGPYISDGKFQTSVEWGEAPTLNPLDEASRRHDSAYAKWSDRKHRLVADQLYKAETDKLTGKLPALAGNAVLYGNEAMEQASDLAGKSKYGLLGLIAHEFSWLNNMNKRLTTDDWLANERREVLDYYDSDPKKIKAVAPKATDGRHDRPVVDKVPTGSRALERGDDFAHAVPYPQASSARVAPDHTELGEDGRPIWTSLPNGRWFRRKKKQKTNKINPQVVAVKPVPRPNALAPRKEEQACAENTIYSNMYDPYWNINPLKMKRNKVAALARKNRAVVVVQKKSK